MNQVIDKLNLVRSAPRKPTLKADITDQAAREIIRAEGEQRDAKTARLREARLLREKALAEMHREEGDPPLRTGAKRKIAKAV